MKLQRGFSLVEMLVVITIIGILAALAIPNMTRVRNKARESEVKANLHVIQEAVERYYVSENEYPPFLVGGDQNAWPVFYLRMGYPDNEPVIYDPLIEYNYLDSYPKNPFVDEDKAGQYLVVTGGSISEPASGDPRFGMEGKAMPNSVDDPLWFTVGDTNVCETINTDGDYQIDNYGVYGGHKLGSGEPDRYIIPGSFFYRACGELNMINSLADNPDPDDRRDFVYQAYDRYILGGFGHETTKGLDVIRLTGAGDYRHWPDVPTDNFPWDIPLLLPEVFGGGDNENNPYFPYTPPDPGREFPFGAPDGLEDGVVIVMTSSGESMNF